MAEGQIHYRASFRLYPLGPDPNLLDPLRNLALQWVKSQVDLPPMMEQLGFFAGASWGSLEKTLVRTLHHRWPESQHELWALRLVHPCNRHPGRCWCTDLVVQTLPGCLKVSIKQTHQRTRGYLGPPLPHLAPKVPELVKMLLADPRWDPRDGGLSLRPALKTLQPGGAAALRDLLLHPERFCPVLVSVPDPYGKYLLDSALLGQALDGAIHLFTTEPGTFHILKAELGWVLSREMQPVWAGIRIFQPGINPPGARGWKQESLRHRFYLQKNLRMPPQDTLQVFAQCVASRLDLPGEVSDLDQAGALVQKVQMESLSSRVKQWAEGNQELREWMALIEAENARLSEANAQLQGRVGDLESQVSQLEATLGQAQYQTQQASQSAAGLRTQVLQSSTKLKVLNNLHQLPRTLPEVLQTLARLFNGKVIFTPQAQASAEESDFDNIPAAWEALWALCTHLPKLLFQEGLAMRPALLRLSEETGLDASANEGEMTRDDRKLMALRRVEWDGKTYSIEPHLKLDRGKRYLRVHFAADFEKQVLILGHAGNHLDTVGTRRGRGR